VPLIEEGSEGIDDGSATGAAAAESEAVRLADLLMPLRVGLVHGRMKPLDRDGEMARFRDGELDVLVGTTVIEVGVDVPEATMMIIENADRFGLAQLHQLRGRVGRGTAESFCVLVSDSTDETAVARLAPQPTSPTGSSSRSAISSFVAKAMSSGSPRAGCPGLRVASLTRPDHRDLAVRARAAAERLLDENAGLVDDPADLAPLARELRSGWLRRLVAADPASGS
jgi:ATP-dependent DNA helicase RecG